MNILLRIAFRNLREHKTKTVIIGSIIALGLVILVVGNSLLDTAEQGIRKMYTENFTGQAVVTSAWNEKSSLFMGPGSLNGESAPRIPDYPALAAHLEGMQGVEKAVPQITGFAKVDIDGKGRAFLQLFSVPPEQYQEMFPDSLEIVAGRFLQGDETGIVLSEAVVEILEDSSGRTVGVGDEILLTNMNAVSGAKIRQVEVRGILRFASEAPNLATISYLDTASMRMLSGLTRVTDVAADLTATERAALGAVDEEDIFGAGGGLLAAADLGDLDGEARGEAELLAILGDTSEAALYRELDADAWQYVLLKLEDRGSAERTIRSLNRGFEDAGLAARAYGWVDAAGDTARLVSGLKLVFDALIVVVAVVAIIIIMNTLVISITERIGEIGTMRAIGAQRSFVRWMVTLETLMISLIFGVIGILVGAGIVRVLGATGIEASSMFLQVLFGGPTLIPVLSAGSVATSLALVVAVGILASLYPVSVALRIQPVRAMNRR